MVFGFTGSWLLLLCSTATSSDSGCTNCSARIQEIYRSNSVSIDDIA
jgi:hypothetical protein